MTQESLVRCHCMLTKKKRGIYPFINMGLHVAAGWNSGISKCIARHSYVFSHIELVSAFGSVGTEIKKQCTLLTITSHSPSNIIVTLILTPPLTPSKKKRKKEHHFFFPWGEKEGTEKDFFKMYKYNNSNNYIDNLTRISSLVTINDFLISSPYRTA